ncbi:MULTISPECIES: YceK/YidQ family lipoprotein [Pseudomonas]|uniref:YceK/YidQ family lipoprotein n=1 Tax=Pseudomonas sp. Hg7Tf TaxID=3236988 RepID=A0AB39HY23_9PSED|nr:MULTISPECIES: YceK/YidQ family lipoprotein [Pseudomonas]KJK08534.1 lipoprotein [Pseudomonas sp. 5]MDD1977863.1 YceK/YidQ family lipoprotein [Pseudomonas putida]MDH2561143.1 YceK/YidQ family lipoprotein [Pseudomonas sp. Hg5Tf]QYX46993.1 YceK/YidQ family lipoprotein [Pseudomonas sp. S11A 273]
MKRLLGVALLGLLVSGCATVRTLDAAKPGAPLVYSGTRLDWYVMQGGCCPMDRFGAQAPRYPGLDLPGSMLLDTLLLPLSVLTALGIGFQATGGL